MKKLVLAIFILAALIHGSARAELFQNTSFEANDDGWPDEWSAWYYYYAYMDVEVDPCEAHSGNNYLDVSAYSGNIYMYQSAQGQAGRDYTVSVWAKDDGSTFSDPCNLAVRLTLEFWDGLDPSMQISKTWVDRHITDSWAEYSYTLTAPATTATVIGLLEVTNYYDETDLLVHLDDASLKSIDAWGPNPAYDSTVPPADVSKLEWNVSELTQGSVTFDVWYDDGSGGGLTKIIDDTTDTDVNLPAALSDYQDYFWRVDTTDNTGTYTGLLWQFDTGNIAPVVEAGDWKYVWLNMDDGFDSDPCSVTVQLNASYTDDGKPGPVDPCEIRWAVSSVGDWSSNDPNHILNPVIKMYDKVGYQVTFTVPDGEDEGTGNMWINVSENGCTAAYEKEEDDSADEFDWTPFPGDRNIDCEVNLEDLAIATADWLKCNRLDCL